MMLSTMAAAAPPPLPTSALALGLDAFVTVRAAIASGIAESRATFEYSLAPSSSDVGYFVFAGLDPLLDALERYKTKSDDLSWLASVGAIDEATRHLLGGVRFACDVDAAPEGSIVFPNETSLTVEGPFWQAQLVAGMIEGALAHSTLVATRFARMVTAGGDAEIVESGAATMYRLGGSPMLSRAAFIGGAGATTCAIAGKRYGIPVRATQPESLDLASTDRAATMRAWLGAAPRGAVLRIDGAEAIGNAIAAIHERMRDPSWADPRVALSIHAEDRAELATQALSAFAAAQLPEPLVIASGVVDERTLLELRRERVPIRAYFVNAHVAADASALARYELVAIEDNGAWSPRMRVGDSAAASSDPGRKLLFRYASAEGAPVADIAHLSSERMIRAKDGRFIDRASGFNERLQDATQSAPLLTNVMRNGKRVAATEPTRALRDRAEKALALLPEKHRRLVSPTKYPVGMTTALAALKASLLEPSE